MLRFVLFVWGLVYEFFSLVLALFSSYEVLEEYFIWETFPTIADGLVWSHFN